MPKPIKPLRKSPMRDYLPPSTIMAPCKRCGLTVREGIWEDAIVEIQTDEVTGEKQRVLVRPAGVHVFEPPRNPLTDEIHDCTATLLQYAARWQHVVRLVAPRRFP